MHPSTLLCPSILTSFEQCLVHGMVNDAAQLLVDALPHPVEQAQRNEITELLARFPIDACAANPDLLHVQARLYAYTEPERAATLLLRAIILYRGQVDLIRAAPCYFELIRLYLQQEDFQTAHLYVGEAEQVVDQITTPTLQARLYLQLAELYPDLGRLREGIDYAEQALTAFQHCGDVYDQFKSHILLSILHRQAGDYHEAAAYLELGRRLQQAARLGIEAQMRVLNATAHLAWYRGDIGIAIEQAQHLVDAADQSGFAKVQIYGALLLGNLYRAQGDFAVAQHWYSQTRMLVTKANLPLFLPWVDVHEGWLHVLTGDYVMARRSIHQALTTPDRGQMMSFNVHLALLNLLENRFSAAEHLLRNAQSFYRQSGDALATAVIDLYLAYTLHAGSRPKEAQEHLLRGLTWLADHQIWCFPYWWHPQLVAEIGALALRADIQTMVVEHMLTLHVGAAAQSALTPLLDSEDLAVVQRARTILVVLADGDEDWLTWLATIEDGPVQQALEDLFRKHFLRREKLTALKTILATAQQRTTANPVLIAVFGLYLQGATVKAIATQLQRAPSSIRNYITTIYQIFGLAPQDYPSLHDRRQQLRLLAQQQGFLGVDLS